MLTSGRPESVGSPFVSITVKAGILWVAIAGPSLNERASNIISYEVHERIKSVGGRFKFLIFDMACVTQMSSIGLGMCIDLRNTAHGLGARTLTVNMSRELTDLFRMMKVDRLFTMAFDDAEVQKVLRKKR